MCDDLRQIYCANKLCTTISGAQCSKQSGKLNSLRAFRAEMCTRIAYESLFIYEPMITETENTLTIQEEFVVIAEPCVFHFAIAVC